MDRRDDEDADGAAKEEADMSDTGDEELAAVIFDLMTHALADLSPGDRDRLALVNEHWATTKFVNKEAYRRVAAGVNAHFAARIAALEGREAISQDMLMEQIAITYLRWKAEGRYRSIDAVLTDAPLARFPNLTYQKPAQGEG